MLPLPRFAYEAPQTVDDAVRLLAEDGAVPIAGGTDLVPSMKHRLFEPRVVVSLRRIPELRAVETLADGSLAIGAATTLQATARLATRWPALAVACRTVATPTIQAAGTLGGNVLLDTRCLYYNQPVGWRASVGYCLKKDGVVCHVAPTGRGCYAAHSADTIPALWLYGASVDLASAEGVRRVRIADLYADDGIARHQVRKGEVLVRVVLPPPTADVAHRKGRTRGAIDYAWLLVAVAREEAGWRAVLGALGPKPVEVAADTPEALAEAAFKAARPLTTHQQAIAWRKKMVRVEVRRAAETLGR